MNMNLMRNAVVACFVALVPNIASAFYAAHMGRWASRDPIADRIGGSQLPNIIAILPRDMHVYDDGTIRMGTSHAAQFGDGAGFGDSYNLYEYVRSAPTIAVDPSGLRCVKCTWRFWAGGIKTGEVDCNMSGNMTYKDCCRTGNKDWDELWRPISAEPCENQPTQYCTIWDVCSKSGCKQQCAVDAVACAMGCQFIPNPALSKLCSMGCAGAGLACAKVCDNCKLP
jgi:hypothetical protein